MTSFPQSQNEKLNNFYRIMWEQNGKITSKKIFLISNNYLANRIPSRQLLCEECHERMDSSVNNLYFVHAQNY